MVPAAMRGGVRQIRGGSPSLSPGRNAAGGRCLCLPAAACYALPVPTDDLDRDLFRRIQDRVAIVGIGHLPFAKDIGRPIADTAVEAIQLALDDAGLAAEDVDGMCDVRDGAHPRGLHRAPARRRRTCAGGTRSPTAAAPRARRSCTPRRRSRRGLATVVVCHRARNRGAKTSRPWSQEKGAGARRQGAARAVGADPPGRRDRHVGAPPHARVRHHARALRQRRHRGAQARAAQPLRDDARPAARHGDLPGRRASSAIRCTLYDCCLETDGALACVVTSVERARDLPQKPALVHSVAQASGPNPVHLANYNNARHADDRRCRAPSCSGRARELQAEGHGLRADLRRLHAAGDHRPRGLRLLQARRGRPVHRGRPHRARRRAAGADLAAAASRKPTCTAST